MTPTALDASYGETIPDLVSLAYIKVTLVYVTLNPKPKCLLNAHLKILKTH